jgi:DNA (cytosine-5)-methyltransferase 1
MLSYNWKLSDGYPEKNGLKVYSTFACGGGSTMGYKLVGYDVIGANDIDPQMAKVYKENHSPKYYHLMPIGQLLTEDLPEEMYNLDILDGSPPCSTFSTAGSRDKVFKKEKIFREGQAKQVLSDLFFDWINLVDKLKPKVAIAENVKGMIIGNAKAYTNAVIKRLDDIGYSVQLFLVDGSDLGLPQRRQRVFFICSRKDLNLPKVKIEFKEKKVTFSEIDEGVIEGHKLARGKIGELWEKVKPGYGFDTVHPTGSYFGQQKVSKYKVPPTLTTNYNLYHHKQKRNISKREISLIGSFPLDYNYLDVDQYYLVGMSVPPLMMAKVSNEVARQIFNKEISL